MLHSKASLTSENKRFAFLRSFARDWKLGTLCLMPNKVSLRRRNESSINGFVFLAMALNGSLNVTSLTLNCSSTATEIVFECPVANMILKPNGGASLRFVCLKGKQSN